MIKRVTSEHPHFKDLVKLLDSYLSKIDGDEHSFYSQYNSLDHLKNCIVLYKNGLPVGCGAIKRFDEDSFEIKRMFTHPTARGYGVASQIVGELEKWALEEKATRLVLETGRRMPDAIALYSRLGYTKMDNYEPYQGVENSICFEKRLILPNFNL